MRVLSVVADLLVELLNSFTSKTCNTLSGGINTVAQHCLSEVN